MATTGKKNGPRGDYAKTKQRRADILNAALQVFSNVGYYKGSLRDVAERVGLSQAGLLHHFPNKTDLLIAVLEWRDRIDRTRFDGVTDGLDTLRALVELVGFNQSVPHLIQLYATVASEATSPDHPAHERFMRRYAFATDLVQRALEQLRAGGQLRPGVMPASAARQVVALMDGLQMQWLYDPSSLDMVEELRTYLQSLLTAEL